MAILSQDGVVIPTVVEIAGGIPVAPAPTRAAVPQISRITAEHRLRSTPLMELMLIRPGTRSSKSSSGSRLLVWKPVKISGCNTMMA